MSGKGKKQQSKDDKSSLSSASSVVSTGPVNWQGNPQYYEHLSSLRQKDNPDSWKSDLDKMTEKFPGVNFTIDGIQSYHKKQQDTARIVEKALSESDDVDSFVSNERQSAPASAVKTKTPIKSEQQKDATNELIRVTLQTEIKTLTKQINDLELELEKKNNALELHMKNTNKQ